MISVLLVDDQALVRSGFRVLLDAEPEITVVGEAADGEDAVARAVELRPDVVLMDIRMPRLDGLQATQRIVADPGLADTRVVVLTTFELDEYVFGALRAGASGFLLKDMEPAALIEAVRTVAAGDALLAPRVTRRLVEAFVGGLGGVGGLDKLDHPGGLDHPGVGGLDKLDHPDELGRPGGHPGLGELTPREREILALVGKGMSNTEIAEELVLSPLTVKTHVSRLFLKLDARDRAQCVVIAYESGLVVAGA